MHGCVLLVAPSPGGCREAVRAFLYPMGRSVHAIEAKLTKADGVVFTSEVWTVGTREISGIAEEIARWLAAKSRESRDLEATITLRAGRPGDSYSPPMRTCAFGGRSPAAGRRDAAVTSCCR
jgi:hypothetical protein